MNPKPLASLNHFTVPIVRISYSCIGVIGVPETVLTDYKCSRVSPRAGGFGVERTRGSRDESDPPCIDPEACMNRPFGLFSTQQTSTWNAEFQPRSPVARLLRYPQAVLGNGHTI